MKSLQQVVEAVRELHCKPKMAIVDSSSQSALEAAIHAAQQGIAEPVFIGDADKTRQTALQAGLDISSYQFFESKNPVSAAKQAISLYKQGAVQLIMKGQIGTRDLLKAILDKKHGIPPRGLLSFVGVCETLEPQRFLLITDPAINIKPDLVRKLDIIKNAIFVANELGLDCPKVALLAPVEKLNLAMNSTVDAELITRMADQGEFGRAQVYGPLALDLAVSPDAARVKRVDHPVAGHADILCVPDIASGNILYKCLTALQQRPMAATLVGSSVPIVLTSRSDSDQNKFYSITLACFLSQSQLCSCPGSLV